MISVSSYGRGAGRGAKEGAVGATSSWLSGALLCSHMLQERRAAPLHPLPTS